MQSQPWPSFSCWPQPVSHSAPSARNVQKAIVVVNFNVTVAKKDAAPVVRAAIFVVVAQRDTIVALVR
jgi:hypothetical protein